MTARRTDRVRQSIENTFSVASDREEKLYFAKTINQK